MMYFSRIRLRRDVSPQNLVMLASGDYYQVHRLAWRFFDDDPEHERDFIYRYELGTDWPVFYVVSEREPKDHSGMWEIVSKNYQPKLKSGESLAFNLCVNPIRSRRDENGRQHRHDVVMEAKREARERGIQVYMPIIVQDSGVKWLTSIPGPGTTKDEK